MQQMKEKEAPPQEKNATLRFRNIGNLGHQAKTQ